MKQKYGSLFALMMMLHLSLYGWKAWIPIHLPISQPLGMKMVSMTGMCILTFAVCFISRVQKTHLSLCPKQYHLRAAVVILFSLLVISSTALCFTPGVRGLWLLLYGSVVTPRRTRSLDK